jgi:hypothetical protein
MLKETCHLSLCVYIQYLGINYSILAVIVITIVQCMFVSNHNLLQFQSNQIHVAFVSTICRCDIRTVLTVWDLCLLHFILHLNMCINSSHIENYNLNKKCINSKKENCFKSSPTTCYTIMILSFHIEISFNADIIFKSFEIAQHLADYPR